MPGMGQPYLKQLGITCLFGCDNQHGCPFLFEEINKFLKYSLKNKFGGLYKREMKELCQNLKKDKVTNPGYTKPAPKRPAF